MKLVLNYFTILFLFSTSLFSSSFKSFEMNSDLVSSIELSDTHTLIEGNKQTILLYNSVSDTYKEIYIGNHHGIETALLMDNILYLSDLNQLTAVNVSNNSHLTDTNIKNIDLLFSSNNDVYAANSNDSLYTLSIDFDNSEFDLDYKANSKSIKHEIIINENEYLLNTSGEIYTFTDTLNLFKNLNIDDNLLEVKIIDEYIYLLYENYFVVYDDEFNLLQNVTVRDDIYTISGYDSYFTLNFSGNILVFNNYTFDNDKIQEHSYSFDWDLDIQFFNSMLSTNQNIYALGNKKVIIKFDKDNQNVSIESATNFKSTSNFGYFSFFNNSIGGYATRKGLVFNTQNGGVTWKPIEKSEQMLKYIHDFNTITYLDDSTFLAYSNGVDGTIYSQDNGETYILTHKPGNSDPFAATYTKKIDSSIFFINSYYGLGVGQGLYISKSDDKLNTLKDTFLVGYTHEKTIKLKDKLYSLVNVEENNSFPNSIFVSDLNLNTFENFDIFSDYSKIYDFELINDNFYFLAVEDENSTNQYLLKSNLLLDEIEIVKEFKTEFFYKMYSYQEELFLTDTNGVLHNYENKNNSVNELLDLKIGYFLRLQIEIKDDIIYSQHIDKFEKHVLIPEFRNPKTSVINVIQPFYASKTYPNPALDYIKVIINYDQSYSFDKEKISLYNLNGNIIENGFRILLNSLNNYTTEIELTSLTLKSGIYFLKVELGTKIQTIPFVIE